MGRFFLITYTPHVKFMGKTSLTSYLWQYNKCDLRYLDILFLGISIASLLLELNLNI